MAAPVTAARRIRLDLAYDGTDFHGWQLQPGLRTVQGVLEATLTRLAGERPVRVRGAGRTDAGVHARGQVADATVRVDADDASLTRSLRSMLPADLRALRVASVDPGFDARYDARSKTYRYVVDLTPWGDPFLARYALHHPQAIERSRVRRALELLPGRRDWSGFAASACEVRDRVRTLTEARLRENEDGTAEFFFSADGFLTHMVRNLVGTLLEVGRGRFAPERMLEVVESRDRSLGGPTAPPHGLCLEQVRYPDGVPATVV